MAIRALVVDDEPDNCESLCLLLGQMGCLTLSANGGREALELCRRETFDVAFIDLQMPLMDGAETVRQVQEAAAAGKCGTPALVVISAGCAYGKLKSDISSGRVSFIAKPFAFDRLREIIAGIARLATLPAVG